MGMAWLDLKRSTIISRLEKAAAEKKQETFSPEQIAEALGRKELPDPVEICEALVGEGILFPEKKEGYLLRSSFFADGRVLILPTDEELADGILFPGHRFLPLYNQEIPPSMIRVKHGTGHIKRKQITRPVNDVLIYYNLFGSRDMPIYLGMESEDNARVLAQGHSYRHSLISVSVFDMAKLYREGDIRPGDYLRAGLEDWNKGVFSLEILPAEQIDEEAKNFFVKKLDSGFLKTIGEVDWPLPPAEELARAFFYAGPELIRDPALHIGGYVAVSKNFGLVKVGRDTYLWDKNTEPDSFARSFAGSLDAHLHENQLAAFISRHDIPIPLTYIEACVREHIDRQSSYRVLINAIFTGNEQPDLNDAEWEEFLDALNIFIKEVAGRYNPSAESREVRHLHREALRIFQHIIEWLAETESYYGGLDSSDTEELDMLSDYAAQLIQILNVFHHQSGETPEEELLAAIEQNMYEMEQNCEQLMSEITEHHESHVVKWRREERLNRDPADMYLLLEVDIPDLDPPAVRLLRVPGSMSLKDLHHILQLSFGWSGLHTHSFFINGEEYSDPEELMDNTVGDEDGIFLLELPGLCKNFEYLYDFGDNWQHQIRIKKIIQKSDVPEEERELVLCLEGRGAAPPEDCGGIPGYMELVEAIYTPESGRTGHQQELVLWARGWHPGDFSIEGLNSRLKEL